MENQIPKEFHSFESGEPFEHCIECGKYLLDDDTEYIVERAVKNYEGFSAQDVLFDYAICMDCANDMRKDISEESWGQMMNYFKQNVDMNERMFMQATSPMDFLKQCMVKKTRANDCQEYQIYAHCKGSTLNMQNPPYMISGEVMEELLPLLSDETVDEMNRFMNKHFSPDPSMMEPTPPRFILM